MNKIRLTKEFSFEMAHALKNYDGACVHIHGHSYRFFVTVIGTPEQDIEDPKLGMVMDFKLIKSIVNRNIIDKYDHALVISSSDPRSKTFAQQTEKLVVVDYQPTCENMICDFAQIISKELNGNVKLHSLRLHETATSFAEWFAQDNL